MDLNRTPANDWGHVRPPSRYSARKPFRASGSRSCRRRSSVRGNSKLRSHASRGLHQQVARLATAATAVAPPSFVPCARPAPPASHPRGQCSRAVHGLAARMNARRSRAVSRNTAFASRLPVTQTGTGQPSKPAFASRSTQGRLVASRSFSARFDGAPTCAAASVPAGIYLRGPGNRPCRAGHAIPLPSGMCLR